MPVSKQECRQKVILTPFTDAIRSARMQRLGSAPSAAPAKETYNAKDLLEALCRYIFSTSHVFVHTCTHAQHSHTSEDIRTVSFARTRAQQGWGMVEVSDREIQKELHSRSSQLVQRVNPIPKDAYTHIFVYK